MLREALEQSGIAKLIGWQDEDAQDGLFQRALAAALYPFQLLISPTAIKAYLTTFLFLVTSGVLLSISTTAYAIFYYNYIPQTSLERPIYLQYAADHYPHAEVSLGTNVLISQQPYDVSIVLHMPRDPVNMAAGNFMLDLTLHGTLDSLEKKVLETLKMDESIPSSALHRSRRPALMPYSSSITGLVSKLLHLPLHVISLRDADSITMTIPMFEEVEFARGRDNIPTMAEIEVQSQRPLTLGQARDIYPVPQLQIYSAKLVFQVRFHGLRYLIYNHRILAFIVFTSLFYIVSIATLATVWAGVALVLSKEPESSMAQTPTIKQEQNLRSQKIEKDEKKTIKLEPEDTEDEMVNLRENWSSPHLEQSGFTPPTTGSSQEISSNAQAGGRPEDYADDEDDEDVSEDELEQYARYQRKIEAEARERQKRLAQDSGIGTSLESDNIGATGIVRRSSSSRRKRGAE